ncbi:hypothetical protein, partial [Staphylococcus aureus]
YQAVPAYRATPYAAFVARELESISDPTSQNWITLYSGFDDEWKFFTAQNGYSWKAVSDKERADIEVDQDYSEPASFWV